MVTELRVYYINGDGRGEQMKRKKVTKAPSAAATLAALACVYDDESLCVRISSATSSTLPCACGKRSQEKKTQKELAL